MWYGSLTSPMELNGPTRYHWDNASFSQEMEARVKAAAALGRRTLDQAWQEVPEKLVLYDSLGCNPAKGGLFRSGPMLKGDGVLENWLGHANFSLGTLALSIRRMPAFFERFPVILIDQRGSLRADIAFRRAESRYSLEQRKILLAFSGGLLKGTESSSASLVKAYARKAQFGEIFSFEKFSSSFTDGVFRTSPRGWSSFSHLIFSAFFFFGHLWHSARAFFKEIWTGLSLESLSQVEYGRNEKLGDTSSFTSKRSRFF